MGWSIGYDSNWERDIGYGVIAVCDHPDCSKKIDRGLSFVCGGEPYGGEKGCGLYFCSEHLYSGNLCERCRDDEEPFEPKPDAEEWIRFKLKDKSWERWRKEHPKYAEEMKRKIGTNCGHCLGN